jgi:beta-lactam-binding protein with PASTA domain/tRNA A-37 threonylcarbamoyl transferase component Bud32
MTEPRLLGGRYELDGVAGRGGMAEVYRARDIRLNRVVAVKTLRDDLARDQTFQARFRREAQSAASLNHPSVVAVYDTGEDIAGPAPVPYIVMEYVDGRTLRDLLGDGRRLLPERALEIVDGVLRALDYSHRNGIVHRDIKPANVMLTRTGDVKVMDFGIARSLTGSQVTITQTAQVIGTAQYLSPEQARGEPVDARSDLYSTGCLLYELLTGRPPFSGDSPIAIIYQHVRENPVPPSQVDPEIPPWADAIVLKAMAKSPADRYQSAAEMRAGIERAMSGTPVSPSPPGMLRHTQRTGGPTMVAPPASAIPGGEHGAGEEPPGGGRQRAVLWGLLGVAVLAAVIAVAYLLLAGGGAGKKYAVPQVTGLTYEQASQKIVAGHLQARRIDQASQSVHRGHVIGTSPQGGAMVAASSVVKVFVSAGQQQVSVPDVVGEDVGAARTKLTDAGLNPVVKTDTASTAPASTVARQDPAGGTKVNPGSDVTIYVSAGGTRVQGVTGDPAGTAKTILEGQGFKVKEVDQPGRSSAPVGTVYAQNPQAGAMLAQGTTVTIYVQPATHSTVTVTNPGSQAGAVGTAASLQIQASDSASGQTLTYTATGLPAGLSINSASGLISGTPTTAGTSSVTVTATDTTGASRPATFTWTIT